MANEKPVAKTTSWIRRFTSILFPFFLALFTISAVRQAAARQALSNPDTLHEYLARSKIRSFLLQKRMASHAAPAGAYGFDVTFYDLQFKIDPLDKILEGWVTVRGRIPSSAAGPVSRILLDFYDNMNVLEVGGAAQSFQHQSNRLTLNISPLAPGDTFSVFIRYRGTPLEAGFFSFTFRQHQGTPIISTLSEPYFARVWWPCKDVPSDKADSARIRITVPQNLVAVSNGRLLSVSSDSGWTTYDWYESYPIPAYLISLAVTNYEKQQDWYVSVTGDSLSVPYYLYPENFADGVANLSFTPAAIRAFEERFGPYPFAGEKYAQVQFPWGGGMEHQTATSLCCFGESLVVHELAHQWWGDMITCANWQHIWLNEGFASYSEALWAEASRGTEAYRQYMGRFADRFQGRIFVDDTLNPGRIFARIEYHKGAWVLHMLRGLLGDETFFQVLRAYGDDPDLKYGVATTEDFQRIAERVSGRDLSRFFRQWIYSPGMPEYLYAWRVRKSGGSYLVDLRIKQSQDDTTTFAMPIEVLVEYDGDSEIFRIENEQRCQNYVLHASQRPTNLLLDPNDWILNSASNVPYDALTSACEVVPLTFQLKPVQPNPFVMGKAGPEFTLRYSLDRAGVVDLRIYNIRGQEVARLLNHQFFEAGAYSVPWNLRGKGGRPLAAGVYFVILESQGRVARQRFVLLR